MSAFTRRVLPLLEGAAGWEVLLAPVRPGAPGDAAAAAARAEPSSLDALVVAGSDATFAEVANALLARPDWREAAARLTLAHVPVPRRRPAAATLLRLRVAARALAHAGGASMGGDGGGTRLARAVGLRDVGAATWALVKGVVARRDAASVIQGAAGAGAARRFALRAVEGSGSVMVRGVKQAYGRAQACEPQAQDPSRAMGMRVTWSSPQHILVGAFQLHPLYALSTHPHRKP
jgi:hypothetical protein